VGSSADSMISNFLLILTVKQFENLSIFDEVIRRTKIYQILDHPVNKLYKQAPWIDRILRHWVGKRFWLILRTVWTTRGLDDS